MPSGVSRVRAFREFRRISSFFSLKSGIRSLDIGNRIIGSGSNRRYHSSGGSMKQARVVCVLALCLGLVFSSMSVLAQKSSPVSTEKINLNTATAEQLQSLPGIGPAIAKGIVDYRTKSGKFKTIEEIINVKGIGEKKFQKIKDRLVL
jgi:competence protein ComEA